MLDLNHPKPRVSRSTRKQFSDTALELTIKFASGVNPNKLFLCKMDFFLISIVFSSAI